ncbi:MAG: serine protease [Treponema sp.]|nr:serine protease [Treponema sp.]
MKKQICFWAALVWAALPVFAQVLPPKLHALVEDAVFEVVVKKPAERNLVYDKEIDWTVVPYAVRSDAYYSIGTAFAVSETEAATAFHVIDLSSEGEVFTEYYLRDAEKNVYEVDRVIKASNERDFLVFTVKDRTFRSWFEFETGYTANSPVYSIGNALGEGIVVRSGLILGTVPEEEEGRWAWLKSSADGSPGNSGGPLVTPEGRVVGIVSALRDNILYSLPAEEVVSASPDVLHFRRKHSYGHLLLANNRTRVFEADFPLPAHYRDLRADVYGTYKMHYPQAMSELFAEAPAFLDGPNNRYILNQVVSSDFPEFAFVDKNDEQWKLSDLRLQRYGLADDGELFLAAVSDFLLFKLRRPRTLDPEKINTDPKMIMDTILSGYSMERTLGNTGKYRILSFGGPAGVGEYRDVQGRLWLKAWWLAEYDDSVVLTYILPMPNGPVIFMTRQSSHERHIYEWDMEASAGRVMAAYRGDLDEWGRFLALKRWLPSSFEKCSYDWNADRKTAALSLPDFSVKADSSVFDWNSRSSLFLAPAYFTGKNGLEYGIRTLIMQRDLRGSDYFVFFRNVKPDERLGESVMTRWTDLVDEKYPFDGVARISPKDNTGSAGMVLGEGDADSVIRYSLYINMENPGGEDALAGRLKMLGEGISVKR